MEIISSILNFVLLAGFLCFLIWLGLIAIGAVLEALERLAHKIWG